MPIPDPLRGYSYESGGLVQACGECDWAQCGHRRELGDCPQCGERLTAPVAIELGGTAVVYTGRNFVIHDASGRSVVLERADYPEIIQFLARHAEDLRTGRPIDDAGPIRRIDKTREFEDMLQVRGRRGRAKAARRKIRDVGAT